MTRDKRRCPAETETATTDTADYCSCDTQSNTRAAAVASQQVSWWSVHEHVAALLGAVRSWPMAGTPQWCALPDEDPAKLAAIFDAAQHWALRVETRQTAECVASHAISTAAHALAALFDRLGRYEPAATIAGFALSPIAAAMVPEITLAITHLRDVLGDQTYESLARQGETMTTVEIVTYAYDQIDQARTELERDR
ncbi:MAG TPA: DUF2742 domain-containing protein [Mycobacterium sp.]|nr:DUF2742 domain-containing protein [Mycobacterium sp.]